MTGKNEVAQNAQGTQKKEELVAQQVDFAINNTFIDGLSKQLNAKVQNGMSFPADYNVTNALMGAYLALKETEDKNGKPLLEVCSQTSIANSLMDMATLGLSVQKKQGYFIAYGGKCQFQRSYFGNMTIARRYGMKDVNAEIIYDGDEFTYSIVDGKKEFTSHKQDFKNIDTDKISGAYAIVTMEDGTKYLEVMNINQLKQSWKQGYGYKETGGTHQKFADQMAKKTVIDRAMKQIINTHGDAFVQEADERTEDIDKNEILEAGVVYDIETNANSVPFEVIEEKPELPTIPKAQAKEKVPVKVEGEQETAEQKAPF
mgnify:CR=1 FL=1